MGRKSIGQEVRAHMKKGDRIGYGRSKHEDKLADKRLIKSLGDDVQLDRSRLKEHYYFHNKKTFEACAAAATRCLKWLRESEKKSLSPAEVTPEKCAKYLEHRKKEALTGTITARTLAKERSQIAKAYGYDLTDIEVLPCQTESQKGRGKDPHWNPENHPREVEFWSLVGARKAEYHYLDESEKRTYGDRFERMYGVRPPADLHGEVSNIQPLFDPETGLIAAVCVLHGKHGKTNVSEIIPGNRERLTELWKEGIDDYMYPANHANVHSCRRTYAQTMYAYYRRDLDSLSPEEKYYCRGQYAGRVYDRAAVARVAQSLGHAANDLYDTIHNYLR